MNITLEIFRFNPEKDKKPYFQKFNIEASPTDRLLTLLMEVKRNHDPSLGFRKSCAHGVCGSDAMLINGRERLACKTLTKDVAKEEGSVIKIEPLKTLPVQRDLLVDQAHFFENYIHVKPYLIHHSPNGDRERLQSLEQRKSIDEATKCILCASCYSACPIVREKNPEFLGPAAMVQASRFLNDSRDEGFDERLPQIDSSNGIWACENFFECTRVCPRSIKVTKLINQEKRQIKARSDK
jgi:succinate dehydrogenase / fumarate reductase iron-sulfur subunit